MFFRSRRSCSEAGEHKVDDVSEIIAHQCHRRKDRQTDGRVQRSMRPLGRVACRSGLTGRTYMLVDLIITVFFHRDSLGVSNLRAVSADGRGFVSADRRRVDSFVLFQFQGCADA